jgi:NAD(P)-dependent dehydrogenase (short-subunit alcohol dehydrogenase family)
VSKETGDQVNGAIVNTSSEAGLYGNLGQANYGAAKMGLAAMTITMARELQRIGVRVNCIAPAAATRLLATVMAGAGDDEDKPEDAYDPMSPKQISPLVVWLCSDLAKDINGQVFSVNGSRMQRLAGWHPVTQVEADGADWSLDRVESLRAQLLGDAPAEIPPFMPALED